MKIHKLFDNYYQDLDKWDVQPTKEVKFGWRLEHILFFARYKQVNRKGRVQDLIGGMCISFILTSFCWFLMYPSPKQTVNLFLKVIRNWIN